MTCQAKDLITRLELLPCTQEKELQILRGFTNRTISTLKELFRGQFSDSLVPQFRWGDHKIWQASSPLAKKFALETLESWRSVGLYSCPAVRAQSLRDLLGLDLELEADPLSTIIPLAVPVSGGAAPEGANITRPRKGAMTPLVVSNVSLPAEGSYPVPLTSFVPSARHYFSNIARYMLRDEEEGREMRVGLKAYSDPILRNRKTKLALVARLWKSGMIVETESVLRSIEVFTVVKKTEDLEDGKFRILGRLIFDGRVPNTDWKDPPWVGLSGPGCLAGLDLGGVEEAGLKARLATGDVPDWFYRLGIPQALSGYFGWGGSLQRSSSSSLQPKAGVGPSQKLPRDHAWEWVSW